MRMTISGPRSGGSGATSTAAGMCRRGALSRRPCGDKERPVSDGLIRAGHGADGPAADRVGSIEVRGIEVIPETDRHGHPRELFTLWMTSNLTVLYLIFGGILISLGLNLWQALLAAFVGNAFYVLIGIASTPGPIAGTST